MRLIGSGFPAPVLLLIKKLNLSVWLSVWESLFKDSFLRVHGYPGLVWSSAIYTVTL